MIEALESRRLLAFIAVSEGSTLNVLGSVFDDQIVIVENVGSVTVRENQTGREQTFSGITAINVLAFGGNDRVDYSANSATGFISGGQGNDVLVISESGSASGTVVSGGAGNDSITLLAANNLLAAGDDGNDAIVVQPQVTGSTFLFGLEGDDVFTLYAGTNFVSGGGGFDSATEFGGANTYVGVESVESP